MSIAKVTLHNNQQFESAQKWLDYIFNPIAFEIGDNSKKYWITKPLQNQTEVKSYDENIVSIFKRLSKGIEIEELSRQIHVWRKQPFEPHAIARLRITAYKKSVVMTYLDNLIAWADQLFRRYSIESINEATNLYALVSEILGSRPKIISPPLKLNVTTYNQLIQRSVPGKSGNGEILLDLENYSGVWQVSAEKGRCHEVVEHKAMCVES